jgi:hypothetical protein
MGFHFTLNERFADTAEDVASSPPSTHPHAR